MCIGRMRNGMVEDSIWAGEIKVGEELYTVKIYRTFRDKSTGKSIYFAVVDRDGDKIYFENNGKSVDGLLKILKNRLNELIENDKNVD